jgi:hypothetical protein
MQSSGARQTNAQIIEQKRKIEHVGAMIEDAQDSVTQLDILHSGLDEDLVKLQSFLCPWRPGPIPLPNPLSCTLLRPLDSRGS